MWILQKFANLKSRFTDLNKLRDAGFQNSPVSSDPAAVVVVPAHVSPSNAQSTVPVTDLAIISADLTDPASSISQIPFVAPVIASPASAEPTLTSVKGPSVPVTTPTAPAMKVASPETIAQNSPTSEPLWVNLGNVTSKKLQKQGEPFLLPSGEACVKIPNSVIEKNRRSWDCFVLGQFYSDPPSQGIIHNIVKGIWSRQYRDVSVSKMKGNSFLFRIPNNSTRNRVINQRLWQIEGQTMFVAKWEPGVVPEKPELSSAPIWLELRHVPLQFFHEDGLGRIAGLVGDPQFLHPSTANKTNLEVAKVFTIIDPRKPLPEAVNVQFDFGEVKRVLVSSPFMPPVCEQCKEIGHRARRCPKAPISCENCKSTAHNTNQCPRVKTSTTKRKYQKKNKDAASAAPAVSKLGSPGLDASPAGNAIANNFNPVNETLQEKKSDMLVGDSSGLSVATKSISPLVAGNKVPRETCSEVEQDSSDTLSSEPDEEVSLGDEFLDFTDVLPRRRRTGLRGKGLKST